MFKVNFKKLISENNNFSYFLIFLLVQSFAFAGAYVSCGNPNNNDCLSNYCADEEEHHEVRCCSDTQIFGYEQQNGCEVWAESQFTSIGEGGDGCVSEVTFAEAEAICNGEGASLCTLEELQAGCTAGTGCAHDSDMIWTSTQCGGGEDSEGGEDDGSGDGEEEGEEEGDDDGGEEESDDDGGEEEDEGGGEEPCTDNNELMMEIYGDDCFYFIIHAGVPCETIIEEVNYSDLYSICPASCGICDECESGIFDCEGLCDGTAIEDCAGECGGSAVADECGTCDTDETNDCSQDCAGDWGGSAIADECGVCDGDGIVDGICDCDGTTLDGCGVCGGNADGTDCNNDGIDDVCEETYDIGFDTGFFEGQSTGDINHDGNLTITDIVIIIDNILND